MEIHRGLEGTDLGIGRIKVVGPVGMGAGGLEILHRQGQFGEPLVAIHARPVLFHQPQELGDRLLQPALLDHQVGIIEPGGRVIAVEPEHVAELDDGPGRVALLQQLGGPLVMLLGAVLGAVAGRECEKCCQ